ncbi:hypothetical protein [Candidatus Hakubella thermalkaliphila]|uniref:Uncharacterized protein n=1 Tax=Candidatus Hakubella thermalkaliphila TaxID=2754717 RepID=A0A6V8P8B6_9ACTN|nr:hypothetical protein [Candidatus Hakubella thermalkaliphila]GFP28862.1 hypothetical protein HKBW3S33_02278 [Candidatus Hakubella thermalkaliphila]
MAKPYQYATLICIVLSILALLGIKIVKPASTNNTPGYYPKDVFHYDS